MSILQIPVRHDLESYEFPIELELVNYLLRFRYNARMARWIMDVAKTDGTDVVVGVPLLTNHPHLLGRFRSSDLPPGRFMAVDTTSQAANAERDDLGATVLLLYDEASA